jgi:hypothetical protein
MSDVLSRYEWRYLHGGRVTHALNEPSSAVAICGVGPVWFAPAYAWYGTGSQVEYERARDMAKCKRCLRKLGVPTDHEHPCPSTCIEGVECCICHKRGSDG